MEKETQTNAGASVGTQTYPGIYPSCSTTRCRYKRTLKNAQACVCNRDSCVMCCPNGCYWKSMIGSYPNLQHGPEFAVFCGVCKGCKGCVHKV